MAPYFPLCFDGAYTVLSRTDAMRDIGKAPPFQASLALLLRGDAIKKEFSDTRLKSRLEEIVAYCTQKIRAEIKTRVIVCVSLTGQGKSDLIGHLLDKFEGAKEKPVVGSDGQKTTKEDQCFRITTEKGWPIKGLREEVVFVDSAGWQLKWPEKKLKDWLEAKKDAAAKKMDVALDALSEQLVVLLVHEADHVVRDIDETPKFKEFLGSLLDQKLVLVPVLSKADRCKTAESLKTAKEELQSTLKSLSKKCGRCATVHEVKSWTNTADAATEEIYESLAEAFSGPLESESFRTRVMESIESNLLQTLKDVGSNCDSPNILACRYVWACARHRGLRVKKLQLSKDHPWKDAEKVVEQLKMLKNQSCRNQLYDADDVWHTDEHRKRELESSDSWWFSLSSGPSAEPSTSSTLVTTVIT